MIDSEQETRKGNEMTTTTLAGEAPVWYADSGHAWLRIPRRYLETSGFRPSPYSYRDRDYAYLEEDCDAPDYLRHINLWDGTSAGMPEFAENYKDGLRDDVRGLPRFP